MDSFWSSSPFKNVFRAGIRMLFIMAGMGFVAVFFYLDARNPSEYSFTEQGWTENVQVAVLFLAGMLFVLGGRLYPRYRRMANLLAVPAWLGIIREKDEISDLIFQGAWKIPFFLLLIAAGIYLWKHKEDIFASLNEFIFTTAWGVLISGFCMTFVFSRIFGMRGNWQAILTTLGLNDILTPEHFGLTIRIVRRAAEEGTELCGYALIALAAASFFTNCRRKARRERVAAQNSTNAPLT